MQNYACILLHGWACEPAPPTQKSEREDLVNGVTSVCFLVDS